MRYIRTKDGILKREWGCQFRLGKKGYYEVEEKEDYSGNSRYVVKRYIKNAIKSADTIEELCDEFVVEDNYDFAIFNNLKLARQTKGNCYGAIQTEWGLKYVAKMNSEGVLDLL